MSKRRRTEEDEKERKHVKRTRAGSPEIPEKTLWKAFSFGNLPLDNLLEIHEFEGYDPKQNLVSAGWKAQATRRCEVQTRGGASCLRAGKLAPSCTRYCMAPGTCAGWLVPLLKEMERVRGVLIGDYAIPLVRGGISVRHYFAYGSSLGTLKFNGGRWVLDNFENLLHIMKTRRSGSDVYLEISPTLEIHVEETLGSHEYARSEWNMDALNAALLLCHLALADPPIVELELGFELNPNLGRAPDLWGPRKVAFLDEHRERIAVADSRQEWTVDFFNKGFVVLARIELRDEHTLLCAQTTARGYKCATENNRVDRNCASYCVGKGYGSCYRWVVQLVDNLDDAMRMETARVKGEGRAAAAALVPESAHVYVLDGQGRQIWHLQHRGPRRWSTDADAPPTDNSSVIEPLCAAMRDASARTLRAEIGYSLSQSAETLAPLGKVPGSEVTFVCKPDAHASCGPLQFLYDWQITPSAMRIDISLRE